jgi:hypothetical protein
MRSVDADVVGVDAVGGHVESLLSSWLLPVGVGSCVYPPP